MSGSSGGLKNFARGSGSYHKHRLPIVRALLDGDHRPGELSDFLRNSLFTLRPDTWKVFQFSPKDWEICDRLRSESSSALCAPMLALAKNYVGANTTSVERLYELSARTSRRLLSLLPMDVAGDEDALTSLDAQSLFGLRLQCAANQRSTDAMNEQLRNMLGSGWARSRLSYPLMYHFAAHPQVNQLDSFLSYVLTGEEKQSERLALKLMLSADAGRRLPLPFKLYVGLMGHPFDALEIALDHLEYELAGAGLIDNALVRFTHEMASLLPETRAGKLSAMLSDRVELSIATKPDRFNSFFGLETDEVARYASMVETEAAELLTPDAIRPIEVLSNMRSSAYPVPLQFQYVTADAQTYSFTDGGRLITALLRSMYMIDRIDREVEARDALRLLLFFGVATPIIVSAPSGMLLLRRLGTRGLLLEQSPDEIEEACDETIRTAARHEDRRWINLLQWDLRRLEEQGRTEQWLRHVRRETKLRASYLSGINWDWVEEIIALHRLRPFRSYDGAFLFIHMELERNSDPLRLRLVLDPLLRGLTFEDAVARIVEEFGTAAPAIVRRYLTTQNMLASGQAPNYVAALDQRVRALEACIKSSGFSPLLTEEVYEGEVRTLTTELLLSDVNAGKFEVPWATFRKDANAGHEDLLLAVDSLRSRSETEELTELLETPVIYPNGVSEKYKLRQRERAMFSLVLELLKSYMQHPAFGLEVILSGRFRHNNLLQELWAAMADVNAATIPSVSRYAQSELSEGYRDAAETFVDAWCSANMQSRRPDRPDGLFSLVPGQRDMDALIRAASAKPHTSDVVDVVIEWIKDTLRIQVAEARASFLKTFRSGLEHAFVEVRDSQLATLGSSRANETSYRQQDVNRVHGAINDAVIRKVDTLSGWFDGVDAEPTETISLADLALAAEALFENMLQGRRMQAELAEDARDVLFEPKDVKIAFDLLREIFFNALRHGSGDVVRLSVERHGHATDITYTFANEAVATDDLDERRITGNRYSAASDAVLREGNSGRAKIAASAATLLGRDTSVLCRRSHTRFELEVPLRAHDAEVRA